MIITFYDNNFIALQNNASLNVSEWSLTRRAIDYDDFTAVSEAFIEDVNPTFVVMKNDRGNYYYGAFAGIPGIDDNNKTKLQASDLKTIFNNEILYQFGSYIYLSEYFTELFSELNSQVINNTFNIEFNTDEITEMEFDDILIPPIELNVYNVWEDLILPYLKYYDLFIDSKLDITHKKLIFYIKYCNKYMKNLKAWEFGITNYGKQVVSINEVQAYVIVNNQIVEGSPSYILKADNSITTNLEDRDLYPVKKKIYTISVDELGEDDDVEVMLKEITIEALKNLVNARYNESFTINVLDNDYLKNVYFDTSFNIFVKKGIFYKKLPVGEIVEDNNGIKKIKIGYKVEDIVFYL